MFNSTDEIKKLIADHERMAAELKEMLAKKEAEEAGQNKIPDDVRDIPTAYPIEAYSRGDRTVDSFGFSAGSSDDVLGFTLGDKGGILCTWYNTVTDEDSFESHFTFPTEALAKMFREKAQLIADCIFFKWFCDRKYIPVWWTDKRNFCIAYDVCDKQYTVDTSLCFDNNNIYFSNRAIAEKCAEWLNYKYKKGEYSAAHD